MSNYVDVFGGGTLPPAEYGYQGLSISVDTTFEWPYNSAGSYTISKITNLSATVASLSITLPDARQVSVGEDFLISNVGANQFTVKAADGTVLATINGGQSKYFYLTDNTTLGGTYSVVAYGVGASTVDAGSLVGYGLIAIGATLNQSHDVLSNSASTVTVDATYRSKLCLFTGGNTTCNLPQSSVIGNNFFFLARNAGSGVVTFDPYGSELIDGASTFSVQPGESLLLFNNGTAWYSVGYGRSVVYNFTQLVKDISAGGTITLSSVEASNKLLTFVGNPAAAVTVVVPNSVAVYYVLNSVSTPQSVTIKTAAGSGAAVPQGQRVILICDSTSVFSAQSVVTTTAISLVDGTTSIPALNFSSKTNTGLFKSGTQDLGVSVNGSQAATFTSTGMTLTNALTVPNGGTGATTLTGYVKGSGTSALTASATIPGSDISGNISGNAAGITGTITGSQVTGDISGNAANVTGTVSLGNGGTGQTTKTAAFDALSPATTKGDLIVNDGANNVRLPVGADTYVPVADSTQPLGIKWAPVGSLPTTAYSVVTLTATGGQTTFSPGSYTVGFLDVYQNGSRLIPTTDYTASDGTTVVLTTGATSGDELMFVIYVAVSLGNVALATSATNLTGGPAGALVYQSATGATAYATVNGLVKSDGSGAPSAVVSGTDIKTINSTSLLGSGDVAVQATLISGTNIKTINSQSILGSGNLVTGISTVGSTVTANTTLTSASAGYQFVQMASLGQSVTLPVATTMSVGGPIYIIDNTKGGYPCGIRDSADTLIMAVAAGGEAYVSLKDNSTAAGAWSVTGSNLEPGLITIDSTFSSTYAGTVLAPFVALDNNTSIHFAALASGFAAFVVDNTGKVVSTPVTVSAVAGLTPQQAFKVSSTSVIVFYGSIGGTNSSAVVLSLSGASPSYTLSVGTPAAAGTNYAWCNEDFISAPKVCQLSPTLYLASDIRQSGAFNTVVTAISVSGTTVTIGTSANIITSNSVANSTTTYALTATTALVLYRSGTTGNYTQSAVIISVSGTTCSVGTPANINTGLGGTNPPFSCLVSPTKAIVADDNGGTTVRVSAVTISGTTISVGTGIVVEGSVGVAPDYTANSATRYNPHLWTLTTGATNTVGLWYFDSSGVSRVVVLSESGGTITKGAIAYMTVSAGSDAGFGIMLPQGQSDHLALGKTLSNASGRWLNLSPSKINGTSVTSGAGVGVPQLANVSETQVAAARLSSGDYVLIGRGGGYGNSVMLIAKTNGDFLNVRGIVPLPAFDTGQFIPIPAASSNRVVVALPIYKGNASTTSQLRLVNVEIAA